MASKSPGFMSVKADPKAPPNLQDQTIKWWEWNSALETSLPDGMMKHTKAQSPQDQMTSELSSRDIILGFYE